MNTLTPTNGDDTATIVEWMLWLCENFTLECRHGTMFLNDQYGNLTQALTGAEFVLIRNSLDKLLTHFDQVAEKLIQELNSLQTATPPAAPKPPGS